MGLTLDRVGKRFDGTQVLADVSLTAEEGSFVCLLGPNGSGKTTILRVIAGLEPVSSGRILVDGLPADASRLDIGYVFQQHALLPWRTVGANIAYGLEVAGMPRAERDTVVARYIELMGLADFAGHYPRQLSGGMQQKAGIARALAIDPKVVLMDEPFAALDAQTRNVLQEEVLDVWEATSKTVLFVTHSVDEAIYLADQVVVLTERPARVKVAVDVELPRPRDRTSAAFNRLRRVVLDALGRARIESVSPERPPGRFWAFGRPPVPGSDAFGGDAF